MIVNGYTYILSAPLLMILEWWENTQDILHYRELGKKTKLRTALLNKLRN